MPTINEDPEKIIESWPNLDLKLKPEPEPKPEPKPGEPGYDWSQHYGTDDLFIHTFGDGTVVALRPFGSLFNKTWLYKIRTLRTNLDFEFAALERGSCDAASRVLGELDDSGGDPIDELWKAWSAAGTGHGDGDEGLSAGN